MHAYRCPSCGAPLDRPDGAMVTCRHCDTTVSLFCAQRAQVEQLTADLAKRVADAQRLAEELEPLIEETQAAFEEAAGAADWHEATLLLGRLMRLHVAGPSVLVPDHDYEGTVVRPAVESFAAEHGVDVVW